MQGGQVLEKLRLESRIQAETFSMRDGLGPRNFKASRPKLLAFDEQKDEIDVYLERHKWLATSQECDENEWAVSRSPLLTEKGLQVYSSMPPGDANNYKS